MSMLVASWTALWPNRFSNWSISFDFIARLSCSLRKEAVDRRSLGRQQLTRGCTESRARGAPQALEDLGTPFSVARRCRG
jgi:hypothetical protein